MGLISKWKLRFLIDAMDSGMIEFGDFVLKNGTKSNVYVNMRDLRSQPKSIRRLTRIITSIIYRDFVVDDEFAFDIFADIPTSITPVVSVLSCDMGIPMISPRVHDKGYGNKKRIDGKFEEGQRVLLIDDVINDGGSKIDAINIIESNKLKIMGVLVVIDREQGGGEKMKELGYQFHSVFTLSELLRLKN